MSEIVYTAKEPVEDGFYDQFILSGQPPKDAEGETVYFPVIQTCEEGEIAWVQTPERDRAVMISTPRPRVSQLLPRMKRAGTGKPAPFRAREMREARRTVSRNRCSGRSGCMPEAEIPRLRSG